MMVHYEIFWLVLLVLSGTVLGCLLGLWLGGVVGGLAGGIVGLGLSTWLVNNG